jgi:outer membrane protein assembly factor BamE (lipoprotein component of BamABCDE complex)
MIACTALAACSPIYSREDIEKLVKEKSRDQVAKELGKPSQVDSVDGGTIRYVYLSRTFDVDNGAKRDERTIVVFGPASDGSLKVTTVLYE